MPQNRTIYVGTPELAHSHAKALQREYGDAALVTIMSPAQAMQEASPHDVYLFYNECQPDVRQAVEYLVERHCPTLLTPDGIIEWRSAWEGGSPQGWMRPVIAHKVACIGQAQARILTTWGNAAKCEVTGMARMDTMLGRSPRTRPRGQPFRLLVMTAKNPGFTPAQRETTTASLAALIGWLTAKEQIDGIALEVIWRIAPELAREFGLAQEPMDTSGQELAAVLENVDAVISTPSTAQLEAMLQGVPVATLDFHGVPPYLATPWLLSAPAHFKTVIPQLFHPAPEKMAFQNAALRDQLECTAPAGPRLVVLIEAMRQRARECHERGEALTFPSPLLTETVAPASIPTNDGLNILELTTRNQERTIAQLTQQLEQAQLDVSGLQERLERYEKFSLMGKIARMRRKMKGIPG